MAMPSFRPEILSRIRRIPIAQRLKARFGRRRHEQRVEGFLRARDGRAGRLPLGVVYETTMRCNLRCEFCYVGELLNIEGEWRSELTLEALERAFPAAGGLQVSLTGGEVFVRKDILDVLDLFRRKGYSCGYLTTNGTVIDERRAEALAELARSGFLRHVTVSIDGPGETHDRARGVAGTFARAAAGLRRMQQAARAKGAALNVSINTTVTRETLDALDRMVDVAEELGVDAIGVNHLMYATPDEVEKTARLACDGNLSAISTFVTADAGVTPALVREKLAVLDRRCRERGIRFDVRPKVRPALMDAYYTPGTPLGGRCFYPFLHARVGFSGKVFFCPFIRVEVGDLTVSTLEEVWNSPRYVDLRRRLLERGLFPVCRRCCKVELAPEPLNIPAPAKLTGRRVIQLTVQNDAPRPKGRTQ
ncbi:MAG: radical SAM protein [Acidobacteria bacterium]|nr:MAG: radical SAM protein [Acidobacteriota bacterium]